MRRLRGLVLVLIAVLVGCGGGQKQEADLPKKLDAELARRAEELGVPGAAAALYRDGELVWSGGWGMAGVGGAVRFVVRWGRRGRRCASG